MVSLNGMIKRTKNLPKYKIKIEDYVDFDLNSFPYPTEILLFSQV